eukprot:scaffold245537_cov28-Attheya_sp.AAC.1
MNAIFELNVARSSVKWYRSNNESRRMGGWSILIDAFVRMHILYATCLAQLDALGTHSGRL